jgi:hypothetical protein
MCCKNQYLYEAFILILAYFDMTLYIIHDLLKYILALHISNFLLVFLHLLLT